MNGFDQKMNVIQLVFYNTKWPCKIKWLFIPGSGAKFSKISVLKQQQQQQKTQLKECQFPIIIKTIISWVLNYFKIYNDINTVFSLIHFSIQFNSYWQMSQIKTIIVVEKKPFLHWPTNTLTTFSVCVTHYITIVVKNCRRRRRRYCPIKCRSQMEHSTKKQQNQKKEKDKWHLINLVS